MNLRPGFFLLFLLLRLHSMAVEPFTGPVSGKFLLSFTPAAGESRIENFSVIEDLQFLKLTETADSINAKLQWVYTHYGIECYFVFMEYFDVKIEVSGDGKMGPDSLFGGGKWFSEHSTVDSLKAFQKRTGSWMQSSISNSLQRPVILINLARYHAVFGGDHAVNYYLSLHYAHRPPSFPLPALFNEIHLDFMERCRHYNRGGAPLFNDNLALAYADLFRESVYKTHLRDAILQTYASSGIQNILKHFQPATDYANLTMEERLHCISVLVGENMYGGSPLQPGAEEMAVFLTGSCPAAQLPAFFSALSSSSVLNSNPDYPGDKTNQTPLLERMIAGIDGDNYTRFILECTKLLQRAPGYSEQVTRLLTETEIITRHFIWNEQWLLNPEIGHVKYVVGFSEGGKIRVVTRHVDGVVVSVSSSGNVPVYSPSYVEETPVELGYFDPVLFTSQCRLPAFAEAGAETGIPMIVPAVFLKFANDKQWNDQMLTTAGIAGDLITLAAAPLALVKAVTWTRRAWVAFEVANALGNLTINTLGEDLPPEFQDIVQQSNYLMLAVGGKNLLKGGYSAFSYALAGTKEFTTRISKELALHLARALQAESAPGITRLQKLEQLASTSPSAKAITRFYERLRSIYKDSFHRDLELDLLPPSPSALPAWVNEIKTVEDYLGRVPELKRPDVILAFKQGTMELKTFEEDIVLIRHISESGFEKSYWFASEILSPDKARKLLALPNANTATYISVSKVKKGTPVLFGMVESMVNKPDFGSYALGGGNQFYLLKEFWENDEIVKIIEHRHPNPVQD